MIVIQKFTIFLIISILFVEFAYGSVQITEVMFDPSCSDSYCEYIEIYNNDSSSINLANWTIGDLSSNDTLEEVLIPSYSYAIITDQDTRVYNYFNINLPLTWIYVDDDSIGGGLGTTEIISLYDENLNFIDQVSYNNSTNGDSLSLVNGLFQQATPTPGKSNENEESADYSKLSITEFLPDPSGDDDSSMPNGEWLEVFNYGNFPLDMLSLELFDNLGSDPDIIISNTSTLDGTIVQSNSYKVIYTNGISSFLNNKGYEKISLKDSYGNLIDEITYSESEEGISWSLTDGKWQRTVPTPGYLNEDNQSSTQSEIKIEEIYDLGSDDKAEWGDVIRVKIFAYKGNTEKEVVWMWIENDEERITKKSKFDVYNKFQNITITYPLMIPEDCNNEFENGNYNLVVDGLDTRDEKVLQIRDRPLCKIQETKPRIKNVEYSFKSFPLDVSPEKTFTTEILLRNNLDEELTLDVWSYPYSGNKKYIETDEKENIKSILLKSNEEEIVSLNNKINDTDKDFLDFKVKLQRTDRKTPYELKEKLKIVHDKEKPKESKTLKNSITGYTIYESSGEKAKRSAIFFFNGLIAALLVFILVKNGTPH